QGGRRERADDRVRQEQHGEAADDRDRSGGRFRAEQHDAAERRLVDPLAEQGRQPRGREPAQPVGLAQRPHEAGPCAGPGGGRGSARWGHAHTVSGSIEGTGMCRIGAGGIMGGMDTGADDLSGGGLFGDRLYDAMDKRDPEAGSMLVAAPDMPDPNFRRASIYVIEHDHGGSLGVVITRRSETPYGEVLAALSYQFSVPAVVHVRWPVTPDTGMALAVLRSADVGAGLSGLQRIDGRVHVVDLDSDPEILDEMIEGMRVFVGYTGWAPGQLQDELDRGGWYVAPSLPSHHLAPTPLAVWGAVLGPP